MPVRENAARYQNFRTTLAGAMAAAVAASSVVMGIVALDRYTERDNAREAWIEQETRNNFWRALAGAEVRGHGPEDLLATDLVAKTKGRTPAEKREILAKFKAPEDSDGDSIYYGIEGRLDEEVFKESYDEGGLITRFRTHALRALEGDITNLVDSQGPKPPIGTRPVGPHPVTVVVVLMLASTAAYVIAGNGDTVVVGRYDDLADWDRPRSWRLDGTADSAKLQVAALAPHIAGVCVVLNGTRTALRALASPASSAWATHQQRSQLRTAQMQAELESTRASALVASSPVGDAFLQARSNLEAIEAIPVRTPEVEEALTRARAVVEALSLAPKELETAAASQAALRLASESENLLDARSAARQGAAAAAAAGRVR